MAESLPPELKGTVAASAFISAAVEASGLDVSVEAARSGQAAEILGAMYENRPSPPGAENIQRFKGILPPRDSEVEPAVDSFALMTQMWQTVEWSLMWMAKHDTDNDTTPLTASQREAILAKLAPIFRNGNVGVVSKKLHETQHKQPRSDTDPWVSLVFLQAVGFAAEHAVREELGETDTEAIAYAVDSIMQQACMAALYSKGGQGFELQTNTNRAIVQTGALKGLADIRYRSDTPALQQRLVAVAYPLQYTRERLLQLTRRPLTGFVELARQAKLRGSRVEVPPQQLKDMVTLATSRYADYMKLLLMTHAEFYATYYARAFVALIASGELRYSDMARRPLGERAKQVTAAREAEHQQAKMAAEAAERQRLERQAELHDLGWLTVKLNRGTTGRLSASVLRPSEGEGAQGGATKAKSEATAEEQINTLQDYRLLTLVRVQEAMGEPTEIYFRPLKKDAGSTKKQPDTDTPNKDTESFDPMNTDGYIVAVDAQGNAFAEKQPDTDRPDEDAEPFDPMNADGYIVVVDAQGNAFAERVRKGAAASFLSRHETGPWETIFGDDKTDAVERGAVRFQHPSAADLEADYEGTVQNYVGMITTELLRDLQPGERLPLSDKIRILSTKVGGVAAIFARLGTV